VRAAPGLGLDLVLGEEAVEGFPVHAGRLRRLRDVPAVAPEEIGQVLLREGLEPHLASLMEGEVLPGDGRRGTPASAHVVREVPRPEDETVRERARPLDDVLELTDVTRPGIGFE